MIAFTKTATFLCCTVGLFLALLLGNRVEYATHLRSADAPHLKSKPASPAAEPQVFSEDSALRHFSEWAKLDGAAAMAAALALPEQKRPAEFIAAILGEWMPRDPVGAFLWLATTPSFDVSRDTPALASALRREQPEDIIDLLRILPLGNGRNALALYLIEQWTESLPDLAARIRAEVLEESSALPASSPWSQPGLARAIDRVHEIPGGELQRRAFVQLSSGWVEHAPRMAAELAEGLGAEGGQFLTALAAQWARRDPAAASLWAINLQKGLLRDQALAGIVPALIERDPRSAVDFVLRLEPGSLLEGTMFSIAATLAHKEPAAALQWVMSFSQDRERELALKNVINSWSHSNPIAALHWVGQLPSATDRGMALHAIAAGLAPSHPDLALRVALEIPDEALRTRQVQRAARAWLANDPISARDWIEHATMSPRLKSSLLSIY